MATGWVVLIAVIALLVGAAGGFFLARKYMQDYDGINGSKTVREKG